MEFSIAYLCLLFKRLGVILLVSNMQYVQRHLPYGCVTTDLQRSR